MTHRAAARRRQETRGRTARQALAGALAMILLAGGAAARELPRAGAGLEAVFGPAAAAVPFGAATRSNPAFLGWLDRAHTGGWVGLDGDAPGPADWSLAVPTWQQTGYELGVRRAVL